MTRQPNSTVRGSSFDQQIIDAVWAKAKIVLGQNPNEYRKDSCDAWIRKGSYGATSDYGWEIAHNKPVALGGGDELSNLHPLHWRNNRGKADKYPYWSCAVSSKV